MHKYFFIKYWYNHAWGALAPCIQYCHFYHAFVYIKQTIIVKMTLSVILVNKLQSHFHIMLVRNIICSLFICSLILYSETTVHMYSLTKTLKWKDIYSILVYSQTPSDKRHMILRASTTSLNGYELSVCLCDTVIYLFIFYNLLCIKT